MKRPSILALLACACIALLLACAAQAQTQHVYRSVGPNGHVSFSDIPPGQERAPSGEITSSTARVKASAAQPATIAASQPQPQAVETAEPPIQREPAARPGAAASPQPSDITRSAAFHRLARMGMWVYGVGFLLTIASIMIGARVVRAERTGFGYALLALFAVAIIPAVLGGIVGAFTGSAALSLLIILAGSALVFAWILGTSFLRGLVVCIFTMVCSVVIALIATLVMGTAFIQSVHELLPGLQQKQEHHQSAPPPGDDNAARFRY